MNRRKNKVLNSLFAITLLSGGHGNAGCDPTQPHLEIFICQGHSFFKINDPVKAMESGYDEDEAYQGFYPTGGTPNGRIALELKEGHYKKNGLRHCQSTCHMLFRKEAEVLQNQIDDISMYFAKKEKKLPEMLGRAEVYNVFRMNCVDFSQSLSLRFANKTIVQLFHSQNTTLRIFCDEQEPCWPAPVGCLFLGADKAAFYAYYRHGGLSALLGQFAYEKPVEFLAPVFANMALVAYARRQTALWIIPQLSLSIISGYGFYQSWISQTYSPLAPVALSQLATSISAILASPAVFLGGSENKMAKIASILYAAFISYLLHKSYIPGDDILAAADHLKTKSKRKK